MKARNAITRIGRRRLGLAALLAWLAWAAPGLGPRTSAALAGDGRPAPAALAVAGSGAPAALGTDPVYAALRAARPDGRVSVVRALALDRDAYHLVLDGTLHWLAPVGGRTIGAVFLGHGALRLNPASAAERRQLALELGAGADFEVLTDTFGEMVLLFTDDTAAEVAQAAPVETRHSGDARAIEVYDAWFARQRRDFHLNLQLRLLRDLLNHPRWTSGAFMALFAGARIPTALLAVDPDGADSLMANRRLGREGTILWVEDPQQGGVWYLSDGRGEIESGRRRPAAKAVRALGYEVETSVVRDTDLAGVTTVRCEVLQDGLRVLPIHLTPQLRLIDAFFGMLPSGSPSVAATGDAPGAAPATVAGELDGGAQPTSRQPLAVIQEAAAGDGGDAAVVFPQPLAKGARVVLRLAYQGDAVLADAGDKNFTVRARESWYPNLGVFGDPSPFELTYRVPAGNQVVSVGRRTGIQELGAQSASQWHTDAAIRVAGFNYGRFKELARHDDASGMDIEVYTNPGTPDIIRTINGALEAGGARDLRGLGGGPMLQNNAPQATLGHVDTGRLAEAALADGINGTRIFTTYFGTLPDHHVAITQQSQFLFGQSWPALIFMPYIAFLDGTQRQRLGLTAANDFVDQVGFHEMAHQWWGHLVTAESYRDAWMEEGFAEFSAALALQHTQGWEAYDRVWRDFRRSLSATPPHSALSNLDAGPLTQGWRVATRRTPAAYRALIYDKGAYVLHMLRMLLWDGASPAPDHRFIALMHDFAATFAGRLASTADFQRVVERHMTPALDATGDGRMDWFFRQWVYGTQAPRLTADLRLEPQGAQVRIRGKVTQDGVTADFRTLVPIYLDLDKGQSVRAGLLPMVGSTTLPVDVLVTPPRKPRGVVINAHGDILSRD